MLIVTILGLSFASCLPSGQEVVKISAEKEDVDVTEEVHHILENRANFDREYLGS